MSKGKFKAIEEWLVSMVELIITANQISDIHHLKAQRPFSHMAFTAQNILAAKMSYHEQR